MRLAKCDGFVVVSVQKRGWTMAYVILIATVLATLIVQWNALMAIHRSRNIVSFYPADPITAGDGVNTDTE